MRSVRTVRQVLGIRPRVHYTWLLAIALIPAAVVTQFSTSYPLWQRAILGAVGAGLFFATVAIRELVLVFVSARKGMRIRSVTVFVFGGLPDVDRDTTLPSLELLLSLAGQLCNLAVTGALTVAYVLLVQTGSVLVDVVMQWLAFIWLMLTFLHFAPAFPLDGGRALRAVLWRLTGDFDRATRTAGWTGWGISLVVSAGGIALLVVTQEWFTGIFLIAVGLVLQNAATHGRRLASRPGATPAEPRNSQ